MDETRNERARVEQELQHWQLGIAALADMDLIAAPAAWNNLEVYLRAQVRERLVGAVRQLGLDAARIFGGFAAGVPTAEIRRQVLWIRSRYLQVETILDFYGDAVNTRTNAALGGLLRGLDTIATDSLAAGLQPLGLPVPPVLVYVDKGLGAAILRAGVRLWDNANPSPAAAIKITRHNLSHPTALLHETGHQFAHQTGWNTELADAMRTFLQPRSALLAEVWGSWASEVAADVYAFALTGFAPLPALANVVDTSTAGAFRIVMGDPHPSPWVRVQFNAVLCRSWFGNGPWDAIAQSWAQRHRPETVASDEASLARASMPVLRELANVCTRQPMASFGGKALGALLDPRRVSPVALHDLAVQAGETLLDSTFLRRRESLRILAYLTTRTAPTLAVAQRHQRELNNWLMSFDSGLRSRVA
jgi:hypothetical protein